MYSIQNFNAPSQLSSVNTFQVPLKSKISAEGIKPSNFEGLRKGNTEVFQYKPFNHKHYDISLLLVLFKPMTDR